MNLLHYFFSPAYGALGLGYAPWWDVLLLLYNEYDDVSRFPPLLFIPSKGGRVCYANHAIERNPPMTQILQYSTRTSHLNPPII